MEITGKIKLIRDIQEVSANFSKREFVIETNEQYPQMIQLELVKDKCDIIDAYSVGQEVVCGINIRGREWSSPLGEIKYFNTIVCWKIQPLAQGQTYSAPDNQYKPTSNTPKEVVSSNPEDSDNLPF
jgi:Domain of unknown function (DUF3127)